MSGFGKVVPIGETCVQMNEIALLTILTLTSKMSSNALCRGTNIVCLQEINNETLIVWYSKTVLVQTSQYDPVLITLKSGESNQYDPCDATASNAIVQMWNISPSRVDSDGDTFGSDIKIDYSPQLYNLIKTNNSFYFVITHNENCASGPFLQSGNVKSIKLSVFYPDPSIETVQFVTSTVSLTSSPTITISDDLETPLFSSTEKVWISVLAVLGGTIIILIFLWMIKRSEKRWSMNTLPNCHNGKYYSGQSGNFNFVLNSKSDETVHTFVMVGFCRK
jgi:hypothetical protein